MTVISTAATPGLMASTDSGSTYSRCQKEGEEGLAHHWRLSVSHRKGHCCGPRGPGMRSHLGGILENKWSRSWRDDGLVVKGVLDPTNAMRKTSDPNHGQIK